MNILITGIYGFVGSNLVDTLNSQHTLFVLDIVSPHNLCTTSFGCYGEYIYSTFLCDMTAIPELQCSYIQVSRMRGQQLKDVSQLDGWSRDGSKDYITNLGCWE